MRRYEFSRRVGKGDCYAASEALYHALGGRDAGLVPMVGRDDRGRTHWWLRHGARIIDVTARQYPIAERSRIYRRGRGCGFLTKRISAKARALLPVYVVVPTRLLLLPMEKRCLKS